MSASSLTSAIFLSDTPAQIASKVKTQAFSGGQDTLEKQRELGANLSVDITYQYLEWFLEDDEKLLEVKEKYSAGTMTTGEIKDILIGVMTKLVLLG